MQSSTLKKKKKRGISNIIQIQAFSGYNFIAHTATFKHLVINENHLAHHLRKRLTAKPYKVKKFSEALQAENYFNVLHCGISVKSDLLVILAKLLVFYLWLVLSWYILYKCAVYWKTAAFRCLKSSEKRVGITPTSCVLQCGRAPFASDVAYENTAEERLKRKQT